MNQSLGYLIAAQFQAATLIIFAWWAGDWLNREYPMSFNWWLVTYAIAVIAIFQTFYVIIRSVLKKKDAPAQDGPKPPGGGV